jgi:hypothetical protein
MEASTRERELAVRFVAEARPWAVPRPHPLPLAEVEAKAAAWGHRAAN